MADGAPRIPRATLSADDYRLLDAAVADLRAWDEAQRSVPGQRVDPMVGQAAEQLERVTTAEEDTGPQHVLPLLAYRDLLDFYEYAVVSAGVAGDEAARETRLAAAALLKRLRDEASRAS